MKIGQKLSPFNSVNSVIWKRPFLKKVEGNANAGRYQNFRRRLAKLVARLLATAALWVRIQILSQKYTMGDISKGVANTLKPAKNIQYTKKNYQNRAVSNQLPTLERDGGVC